MDIEKYAVWLRSLGLQEYQANAYISLLTRKKATAQEISDTSNIPITKIYSILKSMEDLGFIKSIVGRPKRYVPVETQTVTDALILKYKEKVNDMESQSKEMISALNDISLKGKSYETPRENIWVVSGPAVIGESTRILSNLKNEIYLVTNPADFMNYHRSSEVLKCILRIGSNDNIIGRFIFPKSYFDVKNREKLRNMLNEIGKDKRELFVKYQKAMHEADNVQVRCIDDNKINITGSSEDGCTGCIMFQKLHHRFSAKKLVIYDSAVSEMLKEYIISMWDLAEDIDPKWINLLEEEVEKIQY